MLTSMCASIDKSFSFNVLMLAETFPSKPVSAKLAASSLLEVIKSLIDSAWIKSILPLKYARFENSPRSAILAPFFITSWIILLITIKLPWTVISITSSPVNEFGALKLNNKTSSITLSPSIIFPKLMFLAKVVFIFLLNICPIIENDFLPDILINPIALSIGAVASATIVSVNKLIPLLLTKL